MSWRRGKRLQHRAETLSTGGEGVPREEIYERQESLQRQLQMSLSAPRERIRDRLCERLSPRRAETPPDAEAKESLELLAEERIGAPRTAAQICNDGFELALLEGDPLEVQALPRPGLVARRATTRLIEALSRV